LRRLQNAGLLLQVIPEHYIRTAHMQPSAARYAVDRHQFMLDSGQQPSDRRPCGPGRAGVKPGARPSPVALEEAGRTSRAIVE
jgi:hypothetical protein